MYNTEYKFTRDCKYGYRGDVISEDTYRVLPFWYRWFYLKKVEIRDRIFKGYTGRTYRAGGVISRTNRSVPLKDETLYYGGNNSLPSQPIFIDDPLPLFGMDLANPEKESEQVEFGGGQFGGGGATSDWSDSDDKHSDNRDNYDSDYSFNDSDLIGSGGGSDD